MEYKNKKVWSESPEIADDYRRAYLDGINDFIKNKVIAAKDLRRAFMPPEELVRDPERYRKEYYRTFGVPNLSENPPVVERKKVGEDDFSDIFRLKIWITPEIPFYAMLLMPKKADGKVPLVVFQHGGGGTPELAADFYGENNYNKAGRRIAERGCAVLMPQLLLWSLKEIETQRAHPIDFNRQEIDKDLKRFGISITGLEIAAIMRAIDYAVSLPEIDADKIGMTGLSYGGYFTLHTMAADTRIKVGYAVGEFNDRDAYPWYDWTYFGGSLRFHNAEVGALCAPRKLIIQIGRSDPVFNFESALSEIDRMKVYFDAYGVPENLKISLWDGAHTYSDSDECFDIFFDTIDGGTQNV